MQNRYYEAFIKNEYTLKYEEYQELDKAKLTRWAKRLFMFLYMVFVQNNLQPCTSWILSLDQFKNIVSITTQSWYFEINAVYIKPYLWKINNGTFMKVDFLPFKNNGKTIWWEFIINQNMENQWVFAKNQKVW